MNFREDYDWSTVVNPITDEQAKTWVAALRSGEYAQTHGQMYCSAESPRGPEGYCCLGVANKIFELGKDDYAAILTTNDENCDFVFIPDGLQRKLYGLNDRDHKSFNEIADVIEEGFNLV